MEERMAGSPAYLCRCLSGPLPRPVSRDPGTLVLPLAPARRSDLVWGVEMMLKDTEEEYKVEESLLGPLSVYPPLCQVEKAVTSQETKGGQGGETLGMK